MFLKHCKEVPTFLFLLPLLWLPPSGLSSYKPIPAKCTEVVFGRQGWRWPPISHWGPGCLLLWIPILPVSHEALPVILLDDPGLLYGLQQWLRGQQPPRSPWGLPHCTGPCFHEHHSRHSGEKEIKCYDKPVRYLGLLSFLTFCGAFIKYTLRSYKS